MLVYFIKEILICILLSSLIIGAGHYAVYIFEHNKNINYPIKSDSETRSHKVESKSASSGDLQVSKSEENSGHQNSEKKNNDLSETKQNSSSNNKEKLKESLERLKKLT